MSEAARQGRIGSAGDTQSKSMLTGLYFPYAFMEEARRFIWEATPSSYCIVAIDIVYFRMFNKIHGRTVGDKLLRYIADCLETVRTQQGGVTGYFEGDNFCIIMPWQMERVQQLLDDIRGGIEVLGGMAGVVPLFGVCPIDDLELPPELYYDRATLALSQATGHNQVSLYDPRMEERLEEDIRTLSEINAGMERDEFTFYVQPQCDISTGKVVGAESLVRWQHGDELISPGRFVPLLERTGMIYLLDQRVWEKVCQWLRSWIDRGYHPVPISINISRIDVISMDVPAYLCKLLKKYNLPAKYIKAEITESACTEEDSIVNRTVDRLREAGFLVMMDDFGSGYSSLNMLKSISVDVLKIDMQFLAMDELEEQKGVSILESIVNMARLMGLPVIVEGVETLRHENILRSMGCRYTQGYYYCKPLSVAQFEEMFADERRLDFHGLHSKQMEDFHIREFMDGNLFTDTLVNNIMGPAAIYDVYKSQIEISRVNEKYYHMTGLERMDDQTLDRKVWNSVRDDDRPVMLGLFNEAYEKYPINAEGYIHYLRVDGQVLWVSVKVFFLQEQGEHRLFYVSFVDMTALEEKRNERIMRLRPKSKRTGTPKQEWLDQCYGSLPCGYGLFRILPEEEADAGAYEVLYTNRELEKMCGGDARRLPLLLQQAFENDMALLRQRARQVAFLGDTFTHCAYSSVSRHYFQFTLYQHCYGCFACLTQDVTHMQVQKRALNSLVNAYREVYYIQLQDNYCRKIHPEDDLIMDRGNYESMVERHFGTGRILRHDEENVRRFLSLDHLRAALTEEDSVFYRYRRGSEEHPDEWCMVSIMVSERRDGKPLTAVMTIQSIDKEMKREEEQRHMRIADSLASMSDGFFIYRAMEDERILYANPALMDIFGCESMEELMDWVGCSFRGIVHPEDLERVEWEINHQIQSSEGNMDYVQYRIIRRDGQVRWVDDYGHLENSKWGEEHRLFYVFLQDITDTITQAQKEKLLNANHFYAQEEETAFPVMDTDPQ